MKTQIKQIVLKSLIELNLNFDEKDLEVSFSNKDADFSTSIALKLAKQLKKSPMEIAKEIKYKIPSVDFISKIEIANPGFINFYLTSESIIGNLKKVDKDYGRMPDKNFKINVEYISANPTGYLHLGHARNAAYGDALANVLKYAGNKVTKEYYINDAGSQIDKLAICV
jgi:arginyl-tRNA synthetase